MSDRPLPLGLVQNIVHQAAPLSSQAARALDSYEVDIVYRAWCYVEAWYSDVGNFAKLAAGYINDLRGHSIQQPMVQLRAQHNLSMPSVRAEAVQSLVQRWVADPPQ